MRHSLFYRGLAKVQTLVVSSLMKAQQGSAGIGEDIHLQYYTPAQIEAESRLLDGPASSVVPSSLLIVIPFRDKWEMTERCLDGLLRQDLKGFRILVALVDNGSIEAETSDGIARIKPRFKAAGWDVRHLVYDVPFNFSYLNNQAVKDCQDFEASFLALINNDIEFLEDNSLIELVNGCALPNVGAVGCTLLYPGGLIQHLFVFVGSKIVGSHPYKGNALDIRAKWYEQPRAVGAVTGAVMIMRTETFNQVGGFDENLPTSYQDVDLCLKFQKLGLVNWVIPHIMMIHHETQTRRDAPSWKEAEYVERKWGDYLYKNPFVSLNWSRKSEHFVYTFKTLLRSYFSIKK